MSTFDKTLCDIFDRRVTAGRLPLAEERAAIRAAQSGDEAATLKLLHAYAFALRQATGLYRRAVGAGARPGESGTAADLRIAAVEGLLEAICAFDLDGPYSRLAATAEWYIADSVGAAIAPAGLNVPGRTLKRFFSILREAGGDPVQGAVLAPRFCMTAETFGSVLAALRSPRSLDGPDGNASDGGGAGDSRNRPEIPGSGRDCYGEVEDMLLVEAAFAAVPDLEETVCRLAYGFSDDGPVPDAEIARRLGLSRPKVQRIRACALQRMRSAVGAA